MLLEQTSKLSSTEFSRCDENRRMTDHGKSRDSLEQADMALEDQIYHAFWKDHVLRAIEYDGIGVYVKQGVVYLNGHIVGATSRSRIMDSIRAIPGISRIENDLVLDDKLTLEVASSLSGIEHTYGCKFFTGTSHGVVSLNGIVNSENVKLLAEQCVATHPKVRGVLSNVRVAGVELILKNQPFLQPIIGELIYFLDGVVGSVKQVIINPDNRRVIQFIIQGQFLNLQQNFKAQINQANNQSQRTMEQRIVIPVNLIRYLTNSSGFLTIKSTETTKYQDFNRLYFASPPPAWTPPYPYCPEDVLFDVEIEEVENQMVSNRDNLQSHDLAQPTSTQKAAPPPADVLDLWEDDGGRTVQSNRVIDKPVLEGESLNRELLANDSLGG